MCGAWTRPVFSEGKLVYLNEEVLKKIQRLMNVDAAKWSERPCSHHVIYCPELSVSMLNVWRTNFEEHDGCKTVQRALI